MKPTRNCLKGEEEGKEENRNIIRGGECVQNTLYACVEL
jgi:hypothetical protein